MIYLDNNGTTRPRPEVVRAVSAALEATWANPSSVHNAGREARAVIERARESVAALIGSKPRAVTFTSGGTEAIDMAIRGALASTGKRVIVTSAVEHAAISELCAWMERTGEAEIRRIPVDREGVVDMSRLADAVDSSAAIVTLQWANNETGVIQPVAEAGAICRKHAVMYHVDGTQWVGKMPTREEDLAGFDVLTFSAHKFHGPKGVGVMWLRTGIRLSPVLHGTQERGRRGGTENVPGIAGAGAAAASALAWLQDPGERERLGALRDGFERRVLEGAPGAAVNGGAGRLGRLWNTTNIGFPRLEAEALLMGLSERGVCASAGAACSSGSLDPSPVLLAMGVPAELAHGSLRFSLSRDTTEQELDEAARVVIDQVRRARSALPG